MKVIAVIAVIIAISLTYLLAIVIGGIIDYYDPIDEYEYEYKHRDDEDK